MAHSLGEARCSSSSTPLPTGSVEVEGNLWQLVAKKATVNTDEGDDDDGDHDDDDDDAQGPKPQGLNHEPACGHGHGYGCGHGP